MVQQFKSVAATHLDLGHTSTRPPSPKHTLDGLRAVLPQLSRLLTQLFISHFLRSRSFIGGFSW